MLKHKFNHEFESEIKWEFKREFKLEFKLEFKHEFEHMIQQIEKASWQNYVLEVTCWVMSLNFVTSTAYTILKIQDLFTGVFRYCRLVDGSIIQSKCQSMSLQFDSTVLTTISVTQIISDVTLYRMLYSIMSYPLRWVEVNCSLLRHVLMLIQSTLLSVCSL